MNGKPKLYPISPLAPAAFPRMPEIAGVTLAAGACGIAKSVRSDVLLVELAVGTTVAGTFTRSLAASAPVKWSKRAVKGGQARGLVVNAGNANTYTGPAGKEAAERTAQAVADQFSCRPSRVFVASTGVIGQPLSYEKIIGALPGLRRQLSPMPWDTAAKAIMTTDTFPKGATRQARIGGVPVTINGIAKGSGMIAPNMATMLAFAFTDAAIPAKVLQSLMSGAVDKSFNCITVDSDTSTSDTALLFATGAAKHPAVKRANDPVLDDFRAKLDDLMTDLAHQIVRDGEGASKFVAITVSGAESDKAARRIGLSIANSPLVKTAIAGADANWGRIIMAVGKAGEKAAIDKLLISIGGHPVTRGGGPVPGYDEAPVASHMKGQEVEISVDVAVGSGAATVWTCDLTHGYIDINADYRS
ncbi:MAG TPA: bifunctional glutamate N-acetyltransferase/amino-acid acetyltransferase ArgJ [Rhodospirillales bacterium]|jgi:glutamate N-acetyltransferase/amino-acid N-acetyltransferase